MLTPVQLVKLGFLLRCAQDGLDYTEIDALVKQALAVKQAVDPLTWLGGKAFGALPGLGELGLTLGVGGPVLAGGGLGYMAAKLKQDEGASIEETKKEELSNEYERLATEAEANARRRRLQAATGRRISRMVGPRM